MSIPTPALFKVRFTEFTEIEDERIQMFIDDSQLLVGTNWGALRNLGINYYTAHLLQLSEEEKDGGSKTAHQPIASESVETVSTGYGALTNKEQDSFLASSSYGQYFIYLKRKVAIGGVKIV